MMDNIVKEVGEDNIIQVMLDNATNYKVVIKCWWQRGKYYFGCLVLHIMLT